MQREDQLLMALNTTQWSQCGRNEDWEWHFGIHHSPATVCGFHSLKYKPHKHTTTALVTVFLALVLSTE